MDTRDGLGDRLRRAGRGATALGSPLYAELFASAAEDVVAGGAVWNVLAPFAHESSGAALPMRFMAAVHRLVLRGDAPALAPHYVSVGGSAGPEGAWQPFRDTLAQHTDVLRELIAMPCQTNEVGRSAALVGGFLEVAHRFGLPLRCLEVGASAGLNLRWDRFHYGGGGASWGRSDSRCRMDGHWRTPPRHLELMPVVVERRGCDPNPVDPTNPEGRLGLTAAVWGDQADRHERLRAALEIAAEVPAPVDPESVGTWLAERLAERAPGVTTVVSHSVVWQYVAATDRDAARAALYAAGAQATRAAPLAWLHFEPDPPETPDRGVRYPITLTTWPGGQTQVLGSAHAHGQAVVWGDAGGADLKPRG